MATRAPGIDVSHWQARTPPLGGVSFLIAKASEGTTPDDKYGQHIGNARSAGIVTGAYHFARNDVDIAKQVAAFVRYAGDVDLYALDVEGFHATSLAQTKAFLAKFRAATGKRIGLYMSESGFYRDAGQDWNWVANWSQQPRIAWRFWQYGKSTLHTPPPSIDGDYYNGTTAELREWIGAPMTPLELNTVAPKVVALSVGDQLYNPDGTPLVKMSVNAKRTSPYGAKRGTTAYRLLHVTTGGKVTLALVRNADVTITDPAPDATPYSAADIAALEARISAKNTALRAIASEAAQAADA